MDCYSDNITNKHTLIFLTHQLTNNLVQGGGGEKKPALGRTWLHLPHTRILVSCDKGQGDPSLVVSSQQRYVKLLKSSRQVRFEVNNI